MYMYVVYMCMYMFFIKFTLSLKSTVCGTKGDNPLEIAGLKINNYK